MSDLKIGTYEHYKGKRYEVIGVAHHTETLEEMVTYRALYDDPEFGRKALWVRPKSMFLESLEVDGKEVLRFTLVDEK